LGQTYFETQIKEIQLTPTFFYLFFYFIMRDFNDINARLSRLGKPFNDTITNRKRLQVRENSHAKVAVVGYKEHVIIIGERFGLPAAAR